MSEETKPLPKALFDEYDKDGNGYITYEEFKSLVYDLGHYFSDLELKLAVRQVDRTGSGNITYIDFKEWWKKSDRWNSLMLSEENFKYLYSISMQFQKFDKDKGGSIDKKEFKIFWKAISKKRRVSSSEENEMFKKLDENNDGVISFNEFVNYLIEKYNGDLSKHFT